MFGGGGQTPVTAVLGAQLYTTSGLVHMAIAALILCSPRQAHDWSVRVTWPKAILAPPIFATALLAMFSQTASPFLYFQF